MNRLLSALLAIGFSIHAIAASDVGKLAKTIEDAPQFSTFMRTETQKWMTIIEKKGGVLKVPADQTENAIDLIRVCRILTTANTGELAATFEKALQEDPERTIANVFALTARQAYHECTQLAMALSTTAKGKTNATQSEIIKYLKVAHFPSFIQAMKKLSIIEAGLESKMWKLSASQNPELVKFKAELSKARETHMAKYDNLQTGEKDPETKDPKALQILKEEMLNSKSFMDRIQQIAGQLK